MSNQDNMVALAQLNLEILSSSDAFIFLVSQSDGGDKSLNWKEKKRSKEGAVGDSA